MPGVAMATVCVLFVMSAMSVRCVVHSSDFISSAAANDSIANQHHLASSSASTPAMDELGAPPVLVLSASCAVAVEASSSTSTASATSPQKLTATNYPTAATSWGLLFLCGTRSCNVWCMQPLLWAAVRVPLLATYGGWHAATPRGQRDLLRSACRQPYSTTAYITWTRANQVFFTFVHCGGWQVTLAEQAPLQHASILIWQPTILSFFLFFYFLSFGQAYTVHNGAISTAAADLAISPSPRIRYRALSCITGDEISTYTSVARYAFHRRLSRPFFNRHMARSFHPAVLALSDTSAFRRRVHLRRGSFFSCISVDGPSCNTVFSEGLYCNILA